MEWGGGVDFDMEEVKGMGVEVMRDEIVRYKNEVIREDRDKVGCVVVDLVKE